MSQLKYLSHVTKGDDSILFKIDKLKVNLSSITFSLLAPSIFSSLKNLKTIRNITRSQVKGLQTKLILKPTQTCLKNLR